MPIPLHEKTCLQLAHMMRQGQISAVAVTEYFLERIARLDGHYGAFLVVTEDLALEQARAADAAFKRKENLGPLQGVPYAAKDLYDVAGFPTTAGCDLLKHNIKAQSATVIAAMAASGMVLLGKTSLVQFAHGAIGMNLNQGTPLNPWASEPLAPGGSSSGSAVAVATGMAPLALGSDTGGSIRGPAALCGMIGLKTTYGRVSREGIYPLSTTLDSVGILAASAADIAALLPLITASRNPHMDARPAVVSSMRIAFADSLFDGADSEVSAAVLRAGQQLAALGATVVHIDFPEATEASVINPHGLISTVEGYWQNQKLLASNSPWLDPMVVQSFASGASDLALDYYNTLQEMTALRQQTAVAMAPFDALLAPTTPVAALPLALASQTGDAYTEMNSQYAQNTRSANVLGLCALSVPCGYTRTGLPIGLQIIGKPDQDEVTLEIGQALMQALYQGELPRPPDVARAAG
jgi:aspartyl-tRNA(Asn)/glutamyl-tRNA(Gln) amidotransferase subunit A